MVLYIANKILTLKIGYKNNYLADGKKDKIGENKDRKRKQRRGIPLVKLTYSLNSSQLLITLWDQISKKILFFRIAFMSKILI